MGICQSRETGESDDVEWTNNYGNIKVHPKKIVSPALLFQTVGHTSIEDILDEAIKTNTKVKAVSSGHSFNNITSTSKDGILIDTLQLSRVSNTKFPIDAQLRKKDLHTFAAKKLRFVNHKKMNTDNSGSFLLEVEAGITIHELNKYLLAMGLALFNMGGYDGQTLAGVISTSTHGSGYRLGPLHTMVRSIVLATTGTYQNAIDVEPANRRDTDVHIYRIEPKKKGKAITNPKRYQPTIPLIQNDNAFNATLVNMGCFGVIYSLVIEVVPAFYLAETRTVSTWQQTGKKLHPNKNNDHHDPSFLLNHPHVEIYVSPYPDKKGDYTTVETVRNIADGPDDRMRWDKGTRNLLASLAQCNVATDTLSALMNTHPKKIPKLIESALQVLETVNPPYIDKSFKVFNLGTHKDAGFALEVALPIYNQDDHYNFNIINDAIATIHQVVQDNLPNYSTSPLSLRFIEGKNDDAFLSFTSGIKTMAIEFTMIADTNQGIATVEKLDDAMVALGARVHWGLDFINAASKSHMYPKMNKWMDYYRQFNDRGTFSNAFTRKLNLD